MEPSYHLKYAESKDGIHWERSGLIAIDYRDEIEGGISRPSVLIENGLYKMWFSARAKTDYRKNRARSYRIYYAESQDGKTWIRKDDEAGIDVSHQVNDWDYEMIEYPLVVKHQDETMLFYNGNHFGQTGVGYAILAKEHGF
jgi:sucrose-6-phosphate hydrolase SacC (GH32 family)